MCIISISISISAVAPVGSLTDVLHWALSPLCSDRACTAGVCLFIITDGGVAFQVFCEALSVCLDVPVVTMETMSTSWVCL